MWEETSRFFTREAAFHDSQNVIVDVIKDPDSAGFVQVIQDRNSDPGRARELMEGSSAALSDFRPKIIESVVAEFDDDAYKMSVYTAAKMAAFDDEDFFELGHADVRAPIIAMRRE